MIRGLGTGLRSLISELDGGVQAIYDEMGVGFRPRFYPIVQALMGDATLSVGEIADRLGVSQPAATQTLAEMRKSGLVAISAGADRRARLVRLTPDAVRLAERLKPVWSAIDHAARALDAELPMPIGTMVDDAAAALGRQCFADRIRAEMTRRER